MHNPNEYRGNPHDQAWSQIVAEEDHRRLMLGLRNGLILGNYVFNSLKG